MGNAIELTREEVLEFIGRHRLGVIATVDAGGMPEAALINIAVTPALEILFETTDATRKFVNLRRNPDAAMVIGWAQNQTLQLNGIVDEPSGRELDRVRDDFLKAYPNSASHASWPGNHYFRLVPYWFRFSDYDQPRRVAELEIGKGLPARKRGGFLSQFLPGF
jgi:hypothetical protein